MEQRRKMAMNSSRLLSNRETQSGRWKHSFRLTTISWVYGLRLRKYV